jgi:hypothetical protein
LVVGALAAGFGIGLLWPDAQLAAQRVPKAGSPADEVRAQKLVLADDAGRRRGELKIDEDGAPVLAMYDAKGRRRMQYGLDKENRPGLMFWNEGGDQPELYLGLLADSTPALLMFDPAGRERLRVEVDPNGAEPKLVLYHPDGRPAVGMRAPAQGPEVDIMSPNPKGPHIVTAITSTEAFVALMQGDDRRAELRFARGGPALVLKGTDGKAGVTARVDDATGKAVVEVTDKTGAVVNRLPK